jgi:hypothetical protein
MMLLNMLNKNMIIDIYYFTQIFLIGYFREVATSLLIVESIAIYWSVKLDNNALLDYIKHNIYDINIFPWTNCALLHIIYNSPTLFHKIHIFLFILFYHISYHFNSSPEFFYLSIPLAQLTWF